MLWTSIIQEEQKQTEMEEDTGPSSGKGHPTKPRLHWNKAVCSSLHNNVTTNQK